MNRFKKYTAKYSDACRADARAPVTDENTAATSREKEITQEKEKESNRKSVNRHLLVRNSKFLRD